jgi:hypothetical protein
MTTRYTLSSPRQRGEKTFWVQVGSAFPARNGGFNLVFDALPLPDSDGRVSVFMQEARERDERREEPRRQSRNDEDEIPF